MPKEEQTPDCCIGCLRWKQFGKSCWVYWDLKKHCTQHTSEHDIPSAMSDLLSQQLK